MLAVRMKVLADASPIRPDDSPNYAGNLFDVLLEDPEILRSTQWAWLETADDALAIDVSVVAGRALHHVVPDRARHPRYRRLRDAASRACAYRAAVVCHDHPLDHDRTRAAARNSFRLEDPKVETLGRSARVRA
jgi:hypothetical protein